MLQYLSEAGKGLANGFISGCQRMAAVAVAVVVVAAVAVGVAVELAVAVVAVGKEGSKGSAQAETVAVASAQEEAVAVVGVQEEAVEDLLLPCSALY